MKEEMQNPQKIILVRRDNIGDLICTTPAIRGLRQKYPKAFISIIVNSYNAPVVRNNPDIDEIFVYEKAKHNEEKSRARVFIASLSLLRRIRARRFDVAIGFGSYSPTLARYTFLTGAKVRIGYCNKRSKLFYNLPVPEPSGFDEHEAIRTFNLLKPLGIGGAPGDLVLVTDAAEERRMEAFKKKNIKDPHKPLLAVPISARIKRNRWPVEKFSDFIAGVLKSGLANVLLLWAPGSKNDPKFPGDDEPAGLIRDRFKDRILAYPTSTLDSLFAAIAQSDAVVSLDTGSLHVAAAFKKPTVALMTRGKAARWYPWNARHRIIVAESDVSEIPVDAVFRAFEELSFAHFRSRKDRETT